MKIGAVENRICSANSALRTNKANKTPGANNVYYVKQNDNASCGVLSFTGAAALAKNPLSVTYFGAEMPPWDKSGGVGTVMGDYLNIAAWIESLADKYPEVRKLLETNNAEVNAIFPYYNADVTKNTSMPQVHLIDGEPYFIGKDLWTKFAYDPKGLKENLVNNPKQYAKLKKVASSTINWGLKENVPVELYEIIDHPELDKLHKALGGNKAHIYMEYTPESSAMPSAYADGSYSSVPKTQKEAILDNKLSGMQFRSMANDDVKNAINNNFTPSGVPYMQSAKGCVELIEAAKINSATIIANDSQAALIPEFVAQKQVAGSEFWKGCKTTGVLHNLGPGYCGETSAKNIALAIMEPKDINEYINSDSFRKACMQGREEDFWKSVIPGFIDDNGNANPIMSIMHNCFRKDTVSDGYAKALAANPEISPIYSVWNKQYGEGLAGGILNGLETAGIAADKPLPFKYYTQDVNIGNIEFNGYEISNKVIKAFKTFDSPDKITYESMLEVKKHNKKSLLERFALAHHRPELISGVDGKSCEILGYINPRYVNPDETTLFVSWGRGDFQKGHDNVINAWSKFALTEEGKDSVLILGGQLDMAQDEAKNIAKLVEEVTANPKLAGRMVFVNGFAPGYAFSSAADFAVFGSRFEPCGLTDPEAWKYYCNTIVSNTQGFAQKNLDPRDVGSAGFAFKTHNEFYLPSEKIDFVVKTFCGDEKLPDTPAEMMKLKTDLSKMFPDTCCKENNYSISAFEDFAAEYKKIYSEQKKKFYGRTPEGSLKESIENALLNDEAYKNLVRKFRDKIQTDELASAMKRACIAKNDPQMQKQLFENLRNIDTTWANNAMFNKEGVSSAELYLTKHILPDAQAPKVPLFRLDPDILKQEGVAELYSSAEEVKNAAKSLTGAAAADTIKEHITAAGDSFVETIKENVGEKAKIYGTSSADGSVKAFVSRLAGDLATKKSIGVLAGAAAILGTAAYLDYKDRKKTAKMAANTASNTVSNASLVNGVSSDNKFAACFNA